MVYDDFELAAFWVLSGAPAILLMIAGIRAHGRQSKAWPHLYLIFGIGGCIVYAAFAGVLVAKLFPPPYVAGLSEGRGLDLRGMGILFGSWLGAIAGVVTALLTVAVCYIAKFFSRIDDQARE